MRSSSGLHRLQPVEISRRGNVIEDVCVPQKCIRHFQTPRLLTKNHRAKRDAVWNYAKPFPTVSIARTQKAGPHWAAPLPYAPDYRAATLEEKFTGRAEPL
jgi:hypothetical protein